MIPSSPSSRAVQARREAGSAGRFSVFGDSLYVEIVYCKECYSWTTFAEVSIAGGAPSLARERPVDVSDKPPRQRGCRLEPRIGTGRLSGERFETVCDVTQLIFIRRKLDAESAPDSAANFGKSRCPDSEPRRSRLPRMDLARHAVSIVAAVNGAGKLRCLMKMLGALPLLQ